MVGMISPAIALRHTSSALLFIFIFAALAGACRSATTAPPVSADVWAVVDGREIKREEVERAYRRVAQAPQSDDEAFTAKLSILNELIVQSVLVAKATELKIEVPDTEIDAAYAEGQKNMPAEAFQQELARRNLTPADMREGIRHDMLVQKVFEREVMAKVAITDQDVTDFFNANRAQFNRAEEAYHLAQIVITPGPDQEIGNRTGDDATTPAEAKAKAQAIMDQLKAGTAFGELAADLSEDPQTAPRGGDLGFVPVSALRQAPPLLRDAVLKTEPGTVKLVNIEGVHTIVLIVAHETAGQKDLSMPEVKEGITNTLRSRKQQLLQAAYISAVRNDAVLVNLLARQLLAGQGKMPSLAVTPPGAQ